MKRIFQFLLLSFGLVVLYPQVAHAQAQSIGEIRKAADAFIRRGGQEIPASVGAAVFEDDILVTGSSGTVGFVLNDDSVIALGPSSVFKMTKFEFQPQEKKVGILGEIYFGTLDYISGKISKIAKDAVKFRTPYTTVAARGTHLLIRGDK